MLWFSGISKKPQRLLSYTSLIDADMNFQMHTLSWKRSVILFTSNLARSLNFRNFVLWLRIYYRWINGKLMIQAHIFLQYGHQVSKGHNLCILFAILYSLNTTSAKVPFHLHVYGIILKFHWKKKKFNY